MLGPVYSILGPVHTVHNFVCFVKKICQQEATPSARDFFHLPKFSQLTPPNLKDVGLKFFSSNKILCSLTAIPQSSDNLILQT